MIADSTRLQYRPLREGDYPEILSLLGNPEVMKQTLLDPMTATDTRSWLDAAIEAATRGPAKLAVIERQSGRLIGYCGIESAELRGHRFCEFGLMLLPEFWYLGYGSEAAARVLAGQQAHYRIDRVFAVVKAGHRASARVLEKAGMHPVRDSVYGEQPVQIWQRTLSAGASQKGTEQI